MKRQTSNEIFYKRLRDLGNIKTKTNTTESRSLNNSELIDHVTANDGTVYGIVRESHHYFIKKSTSKNPSVTDFTYMGGLENKTENQYKTLAEAEKQRNFYLKNINDSLSGEQFKTSVKGKSLIINEDLKKDKPFIKEDAEEEIKSAEDKLTDLDASTEKEKTEKAPDIETPAPEVGGEDEENIDLDKIDVDEPNDDTDSKGDEATGEESADDLITKEIQKLTGKLTNKLKDAKLNPIETKSLVNSVLAALKNDLVDVDVEDRKQMSDKILKVVPDEDIKDLENNGSEEEEVKEDVDSSQNMCSECGTFENYMTSRGYNDIKECSEMEMSNLVSGYANAHNNGMNDGDFKGVAFHITPKILKELAEDYGHADYVEKLQPYLKDVSEDEQVKYESFEPFTSIKEDDEELGAEDMSGENLPAETPEINEPAPATDMTFAPDGETMGVANPALVNNTPKTKTVNVDLNAGTVNVNLSETKIANYIKNRINVLTGKAKESLNESTKSENLKKLDKIIAEELESYKKAFNTLNENDNLNEFLGMSKKEKFAKLNPQDEKGVNDLFNNAFTSILNNPQYGLIKKIALATPVSQKYALLKAASADNFGGTLRLGSDNKTLMYKDNKFKSAAMQSPFAGGGTQGKTTYGGSSENVDMSEKKVVDEAFGFSPSEKFSKLQPNDEKGVNDLFNRVFKNILINPQYGLVRKVANASDVAEKYEILKAASTDNFGGTLRANNDGTLRYENSKFKNKLTPSNFTAGGTQGKTQMGGI